MEKSEYGVKIRLYGYVGAQEALPEIYTFAIRSFGAYLQLEIIWTLFFCLLMYNIKHHADDTIRYGVEVFLLFQ
jgi:hypothetical protein